MKDVSVFWEQVDRRMEEIGINSIRELEKRAGFQTSAILRRRNDLKFPTIEMAEGLCRALKVTWIEFWAMAGYVEEYNAERVELTSDKLSGLDEEIYYSLRPVKDEFKQAVLKTIKAWLLCEELNKK